MKQWLTNAINSSPTKGFAAAADMSDIGGKAVKFNSDGKIVLCSTAGENAVGIVTVDNDMSVKAGDTVSIQIKDSGVVRLGADITKGTELAVNENGEFVAASAGDYVIAIALGDGASGTLCAAMLSRYIKSASADSNEEVTNNG